MKLEFHHEVALSRHADLKRRGETDILVLPERALRLSGAGGEILRVCRDGKRVGDTVEALRTRYPEDETLETEVLRFLNEMWALGGLVRVGASKRGAK